MNKVGNQYVLSEKNLEVSQGFLLFCGKLNLSFPFLPDKE